MCAATSDGGRRQKKKEHNGGVLGKKRSKVKEDSDGVHTMRKGKSNGWVVELGKVKIKISTVAEGGKRKEEKRQSAEERRPRRARTRKPGRYANRGSEEGGRHNWHPDNHASEKGQQGHQRPGLLRR